VCNNDFQISATIPAGAMIGSLLSGLLVKYFTKRDIFIIMDLANIMATVLIWSDNMNVFIFGRGTFLKILN